MLWNRLQLRGLPAVGGGELRTFLSSAPRVGGRAAGPRLLLWLVLAFGCSSPERQERFSVPAVPPVSPARDMDASTLFHDGTPPGKVLVNAAVILGVSEGGTEISMLRRDSLDRFAPVPVEVARPFRSIVDAGVSVDGSRLVVSDPNAAVALRAWVWDGRGYRESPPPTLGGGRPAATRVIPVGGDALAAYFASPVQEHGEMFQAAVAGPGGVRLFCATPPILRDALRKRSMLSVMMRGALWVTDSVVGCSHAASLAASVIGARHGEPRESRLAGFDGHVLPRDRPLRLNQAVFDRFMTEWAVLVNVFADASGTVEAYAYGDPDVPTQRRFLVVSCSHGDTSTRVCETKSASGRPVGLLARDSLVLLDETAFPVNRTLQVAALRRPR